jgi:hypothetical protein
MNDSLHLEMSLGFYKEKNGCGRPCMMREAKCFFFFFFGLYMVCVGEWKRELMSDYAGE